MIISLALSFIAIASGTLLTYIYDEGAPLASRLCSGACIGFGALGLVGFILAMILGLTPLSIALTAIILATSFLLLINKERRAQANADLDRAIQAINRASTRPDRWAFLYFLFYATVAIVMWLVFARALLDKPEGIYTGVLNNYGDLPFHLSVITRFAFGQNFPPEDPTFAGVRFTYPFITDFISAIFVRAGASLRDSLFIENFIVGVALVGVLHRFVQVLLRHRTAAILTPVLVILNGGFGWMMLWHDVKKIDGAVFQVLRHIPHSYTILPNVEEGWRWGNAVTSLLATQRGFLLGIPLAVIVFTQWWESVRDAETRGHADAGKESNKVGKKTMRSAREEREANLRVSASPRLRVSSRMLAAGAVAGLLPLVHAHSFIVVMGIGACLTLINLRRWREWLAFLVVASVIAIPQ